MTKEDRAFSMISMAAKAGKVASGGFACDQAIKKGKAKLLICAEDATDNSRKSLEDSCAFYGVPFVICGTKEELGHWIGKTYRASICILDEGFAKSISKKLV